MAGVLRTLARLSVAGNSARPRLNVSSAATPLAWLGGVLDVESAPRTESLERLAALDTTHPGERLVRMGWVMLAGPAWVRGRRTKLCVPLVSRSARLSMSDGDRLAVRGQGGLEPLPLLSPAAGETVADLWRASMSLRELRDWTALVLAEAGFDKARVVGPDHDPVRMSKGDELVAVLGCGIYSGREFQTAATDVELRTWAERPGIAETSLSRLYNPVREPEAREEEQPPVNPLPLDPVQHGAVCATRHSPVTVISGPAGCGKTHTLAAIALDAVARGESVLITTRSRDAARAVSDVLSRAGASRPVAFSGGLREAVEAGINAPRPSVPDPDALTDALAARQRTVKMISVALDAEAGVADAPRSRDLVEAHRALAPAVFEPEARLAPVRRALTWALAGADESSWQAAQAAAKVRRAVGAAPDTPIEDVAAAVRTVTVLRAAARLRERGGTSLSSLRALLLEQDTALQRAAAARLAARGARPDAREAEQVLRSLLASVTGRGWRARAKLAATIPPRTLTTALPLWIGTLSDVDKVLPAVPNLFDLVLIDEASHVDQPLAAPALLRARRAVLAGDPGQLRQVSFVSRRFVERAAAAEGTLELLKALDSPRVSLFDLAAGSYPVRWLAEHHRCAPHLISFAARRCYQGRIELLTTHPRLATRGRMTVRRVNGHRVLGVNHAEVDEVISVVAERRAAGAGSVGVVSPFRAQADALRAALMDTFDLAELSAMDLRVGTVHGYQGAECDELIISLAITEADNAASWRFVNDLNLVTVLTTRAREHVHLVLSVDRPAGLIGEYVRHAQAPPAPIPTSPPTRRWSVRLTERLRAQGIAVRTGYPVGRHVVDLVVGPDSEAVAVETMPHPAGTAAHIARWQALHAAGWRILDACPTRFDHDATLAADWIAERLRA